MLKFEFMADMHHINLQLVGYYMRSTPSLFASTLKTTRTMALYKISMVYTPGKRRNVAVAHTKTHMWA